jgi:UPF0242 C-terminal PAS-like domain/Uncharacterised protein family (UPF0242) N-terminus
MQQENHFSRYSLLLVILCCYLAPVLGLSAYSGDWNLLSFGFLLTACGSLMLYWMIVNREAKLNDNGNQPAEDKDKVDREEYDSAKRSLEEALQAQTRLLSEIEVLTEEISKQSLTNREITFHSEKMQMELDQTKRTAKHQLELQQNQIRELQEIVAEQKAFSEKKQHQMLQLETKVGDLTHEIKTLLQSEETADHPDPVIEKKPPSPQLEVTQQKPIDDLQEASRQLRFYLDIAQKIKGSQRFGSQIYSFLDSPADSFSLDLRRLCDRLRSEAQSSILLYSPKDNHLLFASNQIKFLTGWSPDKFVQNFSEILDENEWKHSVSNLAMTNEVQTKLHLKTKSSQDLTINAHLGMIPNGIFRNHVIAVLA